MSRPAFRHARWIAAAGLAPCGAAVALLLGHGPQAGAATTTTATTGASTTALVTNSASSVLAFSGHGWGHGLGLSQWGAYGYAKHGWSYDRILAHYYSGTTLGPATLSSVRVLLLRGKKAGLAATAGWTVRDAAGATAQLAAGALDLTPSLGKALRPLLAAAKARTLVPPFTFTSSQPLSVAGKPYRGRIVVSSDGKQLQVVNVVGLEAYLKSVVPSEMPSSWSGEALQAQAVAARSYALANLAKERDYDLYGDTRSQVYGGIAAESQAASAAVDATKGEVVLYKGKVADTLFFSTSGGRTASASETTGSAIPYLVSVADPYDTASPYHSWGPVLFDAAKVAMQLKLAAPLVDLQTSVGPSGRAKTVTALSANDVQSSFTGSQLREQLELRSTWFTASLLQLLPVVKTVTYGGAVSLTGLARGTTGVVTLEAATWNATAAQEWKPAGELLLDADEAFSTIVKPLATTQYRVASGSVRAGLAKISVAPRVDATAGTAGAQGASKPVVAGGVVQLQHQAGGLWLTDAAATTDAAGAFRFPGPLAPGTYRVRSAPGHGLTPGLSALLSVA